jgi:cell wall-associated NlpC family hydrolase
MRWYFGIYSFACLFAVVTLSSCHTSQKAMAYRGTKQPRFIKGMYLDGHNKSSATANAIDMRKPAVVDQPAEQLVTVEPTAPSEPENRTVILWRRKRKVVDEEQEKPTSNDPADTEPIVDAAMVTKYAEMVGLGVKDIDNYPLYKFVDKWYGTHYRLGGEDEKGIDCSGFAKRLYGDVYGIDLTRTAMDQYKSCTRDKCAGNAKEGDLVFFKQKSKRITHVGVYLANDYFVHSSSSQGVVISNLKDEYWQKHYAGIGRVKRDSEQ